MRTGETSGDHRDDQAAIGRLLVEYATRMDDGDFAGVGTLFARATWRNLDDPDRVLARGADEITELLTRSVALYDGRPGEQHLTVNPIVDVDEGGSHATVRSSYAVLMATSTFPLQVTGAGRYVDRLECDDEGWFFVDRLFCQDLRGDLSAHSR